MLEFEKRRPADVLAAVLCASYAMDLKTLIHPSINPTSSAGVLEFEKRRPADVLAAVLEERAGARLEQFAHLYGAAELAAMCFLLATAPGPGVSAARPPLPACGVKQVWHGALAVTCQPPAWQVEGHAALM